MRVWGRRGAGEGGGGGEGGGDLSIGPALDSTSV